MNPETGHVMSDEMLGAMESERRAALIFAKRALAIFTVALVAAGVLLALAFLHDQHDKAYAAGTSSIGTTWEREISRQKLVPDGVSSQLAVPNGAIHAEFRITGADACVRWDAQPAVDSGSGTTWGCFPWPEGHWRKEDNDHDKLANFRVICTGCTVWADYFGRR